jgi:hypothetical protein
MRGIDLKLSVSSEELVRGGWIDEFRKNRFFSGHGFLTAKKIPKVCGSLQRSTPSKKVFLSGSVSVHGVRPIDISRKLEGYRSLSSGNGIQAYADEDLGLELDNTVYALDASTIDLCLSVFPWAHFRKTKAAVKLHTLLDLQGNIPTFIHISDGKLHDVNVLDILLPEPGAFYIMDRGYLDFGRLYTLSSAGAFFVIRAKSNTRFRRRYSHEIDRSTGVICDQTIVMTGVHTATDYPQPLRRIKYHDEEIEKTFNFLTNNFTVPSLTVADLYKKRWQVELFFKWIKQHLRIKSFFGTSANAVKTQIWIAVSIYVLVAIIKKRLKLDASLYTILQILSVTLFEKTPILRALSQIDYTEGEDPLDNQLNLFNY